MYFTIFVINLFMGFLCDSSIAALPRKEALIVGGENVTDQVSSAAALYFDNQFVCTSTVISPTTVLTAAHCIVLFGKEQPPELFFAVANTNRSAPEVRMQFSEFIVHPEYDERSVDNDIAIMKTTSPIPVDGDSPVRPICLADTDYVIEKPALVFGWGRNDDNEIPEILQYTNQIIVRNSICRFLNFGINENKLCAWGFLSGVCNGDSGGPLVSPDNPTVQIGISSYINILLGCGGFPAVFTNVSKYKEFINKSANDSICFA